MLVGGILTHNLSPLILIACIWVASKKIIEGTSLLDDQLKEYCVWQKLLQHTSNAHYVCSPSFISIEPILQHGSYISCVQIWYDPNGKESNEKQVSGIDKQVAF